LKDYKFKLFNDGTISFDEFRLFGKMILIIALFMIIILVYLTLNPYMLNNIEGILLKNATRFSIKPIFTKVPLLYLLSWILGLSFIRSIKELLSKNPTNYSSLSLIIILFLLFIPFNYILLYFHYTQTFYILRVLAIILPLSFIINIINISDLKLYLSDSDMKKITGLLLIALLGFSFVAVPITVPINRQPDVINNMDFQFASYALNNIQEDSAYIFTNSHHLSQALYWYNNGSRTRLETKTPLTSHFIVYSSSFEKINTNSSLYHYNTKFANLGVGHGYLVMHLDNPLHNNSLSMLYFSNNYYFYKWTINSTLEKI